VGIAVYITLLTHFSISQAIGVVAVTAMTAVVWWWNNRRATYELEGIEVTMGREIGGRELDRFIESRAGSYRYWGKINYSVITYESFVWAIINGILFGASIFTNGIGGWHGWG